VIDQTVTTWSRSMIDFTTSPSTARSRISASVTLEKRENNFKKQ
jgi:hypothetical protein